VRSTRETEFVGCPASSLASETPSPDASLNGTRKRGKETASAQAYDVGPRRIRFDRRSVEGLMKQAGALE
jgi:hypothetical protein